MTSIPLFLGQAHECGYIAGQTAQSAYVHPSQTLDVSLYTNLLANGFRRSGNYVYSPHCESCSACVAVRIPVTRFKPNRAQKRAQTRNRNTQVRIKAAAFDAAHYALYLKYQQQRHEHGIMAQSSEQEYLEFLSSDWCDTHFVEYFIDGQLVAVAIVDQLDDALSAVYTFFDPDYARYSLGVYAVLWQIDYARQLGFKWLYLGYWIASCQKMSYKDQYQPLQMFENRQWVEQTDSSHQSNKSTKPT